MTGRGGGATPAAFAVGRARGRRWPWRQALALVVCSALLTAFSESFYWYAGGTDLPSRMVFYLIPTTALLWTLSRWPGSGWPTVVLAGAVYGFVTEGVLTAVVYGGFPLDPFAISYTSLAWHAVLSFGFGLVGLHRLLARGSVGPAVLAISLFGVLWGAWAVTLRLPPGADDELPALSMLVGDVELGVFAGYTAAVTAVVGLCHFLLGRFVGPGDLVMGRSWRIFVAVVAALWFGLLVVPAAPWAPVELVALLVVCGSGLRRRTRIEAIGPPLTAVICEPVPARRLVLLAALPLAAVAAHATLLHFDPGEHVIRSHILEPVVAAQTLLGWALFIAVLVSAGRSRRADATRPDKSPT